MTQYRAYEKANPVYLSGEIFFPLTLIAIASSITYVLLHFFGMLVAVLFNVFISWCSYFYLYFYGKDSHSISFDFLKGFFLILGALLFVDYGVYLLVVYQKTGVLHALYFRLWWFTLLGAPVLYYAFQYGRYYFIRLQMAKNYLNLLLEVYHDRELLTYIDTIAFVNTATARISDVELKNDKCFHSKKELQKMDDQLRNYYLEKSTFWGTIHIPFGADQLLMSWYSLVEDKYYSIELPFPFAKMIVEQEKYPTNVLSVFRGKRFERLNLHVHSNGGVKIFNSKRVLIDHPCSNPCALSNEERDEKIERHRAAHEYYRDPKAFSCLLEDLKRSGGIEQRFQLQKIFIPWSMSIAGIDDEHYVEINDVAFNQYRSEKNGLEISALRSLPCKVAFIYRGSSLLRWLDLRIDTQKLHQAVQEQFNEKDESPVLFSLVFKNTPTTSLVFTINVNGKSAVFNDWEIQIDKERKESVDAELLKK